MTRTFQHPPTTAGRHDSVFDALADPAIILDRDLVIQAVNPAWVSFIGSDTPDCLKLERGDNFSAACEGSPALHGLADLLSQAVRKTPFKVMYEYSAVSSTGQMRWFLVVATELSRDGILLVHRDITRRQRAEALSTELVTSAISLKRSNEELDQYAYITSHDLKAPLRGIANLSNWIEEDLGQAITAEAHGQFELLRGRVRRMESLIDGILAYSRIGRIQLPLETVCVGALIGEIVDLLGPAPGIRVEYPDHLPSVVGEKFRLQQVLMNLIGNAIKHRSDPSRGHIRIACADAGEFWEFSVTDDGPGIDPAYHQKIFVIFQTLQPRDRREGTGVGLALVKKIVENQGGVVRLNSAPGKGSTFTFTWQKDLRNYRKQEQGDGK